MIGILLGAGLVTIVSAHNGPLATGTIHSCVNNSSGTIHIIDASGTCAANELALDWLARGSGGISGLEVVSADSPPMVNNFSGVQSVSCPSGKTALGGGVRLVDAAGATAPAGGFVGNSFPIGNPATGWSGSGSNLARQSPESAADHITVYAVCATAAP